MHQTEAEARIALVDKLGPELGELYHALWQETAWIHAKWAEYVALFGESPERVALLNEASPSFFRTVQDALWESILLHLCRLTDPPKSVGRNNLSISQLPGYDSVRQAAPKIADLVGLAKSRTDFARDWRNRRFAHSDLAIATRRPAEPLATASRRLVAEALRAISDVLNSVSSELLQTETHFDSDGSGALATLSLLRQGIRYETELEARVRAGTARPDELRRDPI